MRIKFEVEPFKVRLNENSIRRYLRDVGEKTKQILVQQAAAPKTGKVYMVNGAAYTASAPGEFPANKFGHLSRSYKVALGLNEVTIGTDVLVYPSYLRAGTRKMAPRKFLRQALGDAMEMEHFKTPFVEFVR